MSDRLSRSIAATVFVDLLLQFALFAAFALIAGFLDLFGAAFALVSTAFHALVLVMLLLFKEDFVKESTGERLERVNLANRITMLRLSTLPTLLFLIIAAKDHPIRLPLLILVILVFATDFVDGYISRKGGEITRIGRMLDSASDYSLLIVLTLVFRYFSLVPWWLFAVVIVRLALQVALEAAKILVKRRIVPKTTFLGKVTVATIMTLYAAEVLKPLAGLDVPLLFQVLEYCVGAIVAISMIDKVLSFVQELREIPDSGPAEGGEQGPES
jgi:phosphatidylglycerophosphate synthase